MNQPENEFDGRVPYPVSANIESTLFCNLRCPMCLQFQNGTTVKGPHMEDATFDRVAAAVFPHVERLQLSVSGEPLMTRHLDHKLAVAKQQGLRLEYFTNATLLDKRMVARILPTLGRMYISFDGSDPETFEWMREGAQQAKVIDNIRGLMQEIRDLPEEQRPPIGFASVLVRRNIEQLVDLVELAHCLGLDFVSASHVTPITAEMQRESLVHHAEVARIAIRAASKRAEELGIPLIIQPLGQVQEAMGTAVDAGKHYERPLSSADGSVKGLEGVKILEEKLRPFRSGPAAEQLRCERPELTPEIVAASDQMPDSIWVCDFLWKRLYVGQDASVHACCVPGNPMIGSLEKSTLRDLWDSEVYRSMRLGLAKKEPAPVCRGCEHIHRVTDPEEIGGWLGGRALPPGSMPPLPPSLRPVKADFAVAEERPQVEYATAPLITWNAVEGAEGYELEASIDDFSNLTFSTAWHGLCPHEPFFQIPAWAWSQVTTNKPVAWRVLALFPRERRVVVRGCFRRVS